MCVRVSARHSLPTGTWAAAQLAGIQGGIWGPLIPFPPHLPPALPVPPRPCCLGLSDLLASLPAAQLSPHRLAPTPTEPQVASAAPRPATGAQAQEGAESSHL